MKLSRCWTLYVFSIGGLGAISALARGGGDALGGCGNNGVEVDAGSGSSSGSTSSGSSGSGGSSSGGSGTCTPPPGCTPLPMHQTMAAELALDSMWASTTAITKCDKSSCTPDQRKVSLLLAVDYDIDPTTMKFSGTLRTCQNQTPPITLSMFGDTASQVPQGSQVQVVIDESVWAKQKPVNVTGSVAAGQFTMDSVVALNGLDPNSQWKDPTVKWPPTSADPNHTPAIPMTDWNNDDMNAAGGGVTAAFKADTTPFIIPRVGLGMMPSGALYPMTDKIFVVLRTQIALSGCMSSCTDGSGTALVPLLENHVIGCHIPAGDAGPDRPCQPSEYNFLDLNSTAYVVVSGTFQSKVATAPTCDAVRAAFPM